MPLIIYRWRVGQRSELFLPRSRWKDAAVLSDISMRMECMCERIRACVCVCVCVSERERKRGAVCKSTRGEREREKSVRRNGKKRWANRVQDVALVERDDKSRDVFPQVQFFFLPSPRQGR